jgi:uncharacterized OB-fold protein
MTDVTRPIPAEFGPDSEQFWDGTRLGEFRVLRCDQCAHVIWYPRAHCPYCGSRDVTWTALPEPVTGVVYTRTIIRKHTHPYYSTRTPYVVAWVDVDDGPRMLTEVTGPDAVDVGIGERVALQWEDHESVKMATFVRQP